VVLQTPKTPTSKSVPEVKIQAISTLAESFKGTSFRLRCSACPPSSMISCRNFCMGESSSADKLVAVRTPISVVAAAATSRYGRGMRTLASASATAGHESFAREVLIFGMGTSSRLPRSDCPRGLLFISACGCEMDCDSADALL
jgi:hypothetical protein